VNDDVALSPGQGSDATAFILATVDRNQVVARRRAHTALSVLLGAGGRFRAADVVERVRRLSGIELDPDAVADALRRAAATPL
jgi:hypothetical protein